MQLHLPYQLGESPITHATLFERHGRVLSRPISQSGASVCWHRCRVVVNLEGLMGDRKSEPGVSAVMFAATQSQAIGCGGRRDAMTRLDHYALGYRISSLNPQSTQSI
jgi:hypothetical protein